MKILLHLVYLLVAVISLLLPASAIPPTYELVHGFSDRRAPSLPSEDAPVLGPDNMIWGAAHGGAKGYGAIYKVSPSGGTPVEVLSFGGTSGNKGSRPQGLTLGADGNFYGVTQAGGSGDLGTVFKVTPAGKLATLLQFNGTGTAYKGAFPNGPLLRASDGNFYGTTDGNGSAGGTVFKITPAGVATVLAIFKDLAGAATPPEVTGAGLSPAGGLVEGADGNFYGVCRSGGTLGYGTTFKITPAGTVTLLASFVGDGTIDGIVRASAVQPDGKIVIGGDFRVGGARGASGWRG